MPTPNRWILDLLLAAACVTAGMLVANAVKATTQAYCAIPGPSGEAIYCTDDLARVPNRGDFKPLEIGPLRDYRKSTSVVVQPRRPHWWGCMVRDGSRASKGVVMEAVPLPDGGVLMRVRAGSRGWPVLGGRCP